ncbi:hypothetical protein GCM10023108_55270 [Saccharopolyspora hordei]
MFEGSDACVAPVLSMTEAETHPHVAARGSLVRRDGVLQPAPAPRFSRTPNPEPRPVATPGAHTDAVAQDWKIPQDLLDSGAFGPRG